MDYITPDFVKVGADVAVRQSSGTWGIPKYWPGKVVKDLATQVVVELKYHPAAEPTTIRFQKSQYRSDDLRERGESPYSSHSKTLVAADDPRIEHAARETKRVAAEVEARRAVEKFTSSRTAANTELAITALQEFLKLQDAYELGEEDDD